MIVNSSLANVLPDKLTVISDYRMAYQSRQASLLGRKEVLTGKAKFGIFGDGKELAQIAMAKAFKPGDFRSGYYRDQTFMFALGISNIKEFFAQLYANPDVELEPASAGRQMNGHFATRLLNDDGSWKSISELYNSSADCSPTASQMPRLVGLGYASVLYRNLKELQSFTQFSKNGNEVAFGTIGNASCAEGLFFEAINAIGVLKAPVVMSVWDDHYGISVPNEYQITKNSISELLAGIQRTDSNPSGFDIYVVKGWDYLGLIETYQKAAEIARKNHVPALIHVIEVTQPQGHSTSGSHERYKSPERLAWEQEHDCIAKFRKFIIENNLATEQEISAWEDEDKKLVNQWKKEAWNDYLNPIKSDIQKVCSIFQKIAQNSKNSSLILEESNKLQKISEPFRRDIQASVFKVLRLTKNENNQAIEELKAYKKLSALDNYDKYNSHLYSESSNSALKVREVKPIYSANSPILDGRQILQACFDKNFEKNPLVVAFGEDVGKLGDVNQAFAGLQEKYGELRITDTGIREATIIGQGIGLAMRGLRPIAEIQYLDYLLYGLQTMSDDLATLRYRTKSGQMAPLIVRTRGHRLEGIWHSGSPMGMIINALRGMYVLVPRNMTQAAGFYNTMLQSDDSALIIEVLNGYRLKEKLPDNIGEFTVPLGVPEILKEGDDLTLVTYGPNCRLALEVAQEFEKEGITIEVIDVQTLLPFDIHHKILQSLKKTNRIVFIDEDVEGGATGFMLQQVLEAQGGYKYLDSPPITITAKDHRPAYASDGDYFSKPNFEIVYEKIYNLFHEVSPHNFPLFF